MHIDRFRASLRAVLSLGVILAVVIGFALFCALTAFRLAGFLEPPWPIQSILLR